MLEETQPTMAALLESFAGITAAEDEYGNLSFYVAALGAGLDQARNVSNNCPACIMAAIRQSGIPVPAVSGFSFTEEMRSAWREFNSRGYERDGNI